MGGCLIAIAALEALTIIAGIDEVPVPRGVRD